ncbi:MAG: SurA N-terminal domain-containing protein [Salinivirgaceae bacterium]|jgi:peptidyl-prolyl cis-trans isomerase D|nr:SurA N-terminal domain-containing protein [Salinivirgaceae bacterium]
MATLEKIRNRSGLLIIIIGFALLAFILGDMFSGGGFSQDQFKIAEINGVSIDYRNYEQRIEKAIENVKRNSDQNTLDEQTTNQVRSQVWEQLVQEHVLGEEFSESGISVSTEELKDMVVGNNIHPQVRQIPIFQNEAGQFDPSLVKQFLARLEQDPQARSTWLSFEQGLKQERVNSKYYTAIQKGLFVTDLHAKEEAIDKQKKVDFKYVALPYTSVKDEEVQVNENDINKYYEEHKNLFKQEKAVDVEYITYKVEPTQEDIKNIKADLKDLLPEFKTTENIAQFVTATSDNTYDPTFYKKGEYENPMIDSIMFNNEEGHIYGPYKENSQYKITKIAHVETRPDTIKVRHIALVPGEQQTAEQVDSIADNIIKQLENGANFAKLATEFSADQETAVNGGDLGWRNVQQLVYGEALLDAGKGEFIKMPTQQAIFIAEMTQAGESVKQIQLASITRDIEPSEETREDVYQKANVFAANYQTAKAFQEGVEKEGLVKKQANNLKETSRNIAGLQNARNIIRAAFSSDASKLIMPQNMENPVFELEDNYVIGVVTKKYEEGYAAIAEVRATIEKEVLKEKKAKILQAKANDALKQSSNLDDLATKLAIDVKTSNGVTFGAFSIPGLGIEPKVQGTAIALEKDEISEPITGNNAVYVIQISNIIEPANLNIAMQKQSMARTMQSRVQREVLEALKDNAEIEDNRINFY